MKLTDYSLTDVGLKRDHNEDFFHVNQEAQVYLVCDGMGGYAAGEVASKMCAESISEQVEANQHIIEQFKEQPTVDSRELVRRMLIIAIQKSCKEVFDSGKSDPDKLGMGTTLVMALVIGNNAFIAHVGDSRAYLFRMDEVHQVTEDHSMVNELVQQGILTAEQAAKHPQANLITRAIGHQETVQPDVLHMELMEGDLFLLCSDGLCGYMKKAEFHRIAISSQTAEMAEKLIALANGKGGKDNITAVIIQAGERDSAVKSDDSAAKKVATLKKIPLFKNFDYKEIIKILEVIEVSKYAAGKNIITEGQGGEEMFVILSGEVSVKKGEVQLINLKSGNFFGEMSLIDKTPRSATISAAKDTKLMVLARTPLFKLLKKEPRLAMKLFWSFLQNMNKRLRRNDQELLKLKDSKQAVKKVVKEVPKTAPQKSSKERDEPSYGTDLSFLDD
ncbi:MAG: Stp1/IreP family PP2C-type Ser/Thr phosphatase [Halobacteriovoraceae bacterium]|jgi:PPM family protein phosphatase|nr:Stp1/IreP family PP2C-type Ser/Thr phosphatase [Halobacteriovoraceae bacterium]MBT5095791.1 Stp1/IreP family PP2C-type Ser/Thr phosphatase [Halobacteriovoraceae bacterium]